MELKDIKDLMKILKDEEMSEMKVRYGKIKLTLVNSEIKKEEPKVEIKNKLVETKNVKKEEIVKAKNVGVIKLSKIEKGMNVQKGMLLARVNTIGIDTDIKATADGILSEILIADNSAVDFAKPLFVIEVE